MATDDFKENMNNFRVATKEILKKNRFRHLLQMCLMQRLTVSWCKSMSMRSAILLVNNT